MPISKIKSSAIDANAITGAGIADGTVDTADLAAGAVTSAKLDTNIAIDGTLTVGDGSGNETLTILSGSTNEGYLRFADGTSGSSAYQGRVEYDHTNGKLNMGAGGTTPVTIDSSGNMGVGTNSPASILDVTDSSTNQPTVRLSTATATNYLTIGRDSSTGHYNFKSDETGSSIQFYTDPDGTGPVNRMSINRYGYITKPNQISFWTWLNSNQTGYDGFTNSGWGTNYIEFNYEEYDIGGGYQSNGVDIGKFIAPVAGTYWFGTAVYGQNFSSGGWGQAWFNVNGARKSGTDIVMSNATGGFIYYTNIIKLAASDAVTVHPYSSSGNTNVTIQGNANHTWFKGYLLG